MLSRIFTRCLATTNHGAFPPHMKEFLETRLKKETFDRILTSKVLELLNFSQTVCLGLF